MHIIWMLIVGLIVGAIAKLLMPGRDPGGIIVTMLLGISDGAIAGWYGQVTTQSPGDRTLEALYGNWAEGQGVEQRLGNPSFTPAVVASIEAAEVCKVLLGTGRTLRSRVISIDLLNMTFEEMALENRAQKAGA